ncbi:hypothetical protein U1Q18_052486 [Sarracenia purpurea var. burkii]
MKGDLSATKSEQKKLRKVIKKLKRMLKETKSERNQAHEIEEDNECNEGHQNSFNDTFETIDLGGDDSEMKCQDAIAMTIRVTPTQFVEPNLCRDIVSVADMVFHTKEPVMDNRFRVEEEVANDINNA